MVNYKNLLGIVTIFLKRESKRVVKFTAEGGLHRA